MLHKAKRKVEKWLKPSVNRMRFVMNTSGFR